MPPRLSGRRTTRPDRNTESHAANFHICVPASFHLGHLHTGVAVVMAGLEDGRRVLDMEIAARQLDGVHRRGDHIAMSHSALKLVVLPRVIHNYLARAD